MNIIQITPGAGAMYCGNCLRDNAFVAALRKAGHDALMIPLYLPLTLEEEDQSAGTPIFFSGINVYLQQMSPLFREAPDWFHNLLASPRLLKWAAGRAASTRAADLGELTLSMLQGEEGNQARELDELLAWLKTKPRPDVICLSNALLLGLVRGLKTELGVPIVCTLQGEDGFLDALPESHRSQCWQTLANRAAEVDLFISPSRYFADLMSKRLSLSADRVAVVYNGINLDGYRQAAAAAARPTSPVLGFFARMSPEKGLDTLVDAFIAVRKRARANNLKLRVGGSCGPADEPFVESLRQRLASAGLLGDVEFHPNLSREQKLDFLHSLSLFSVPAGYGEAFGLYVIESLAAGVPVIQPRTAAFPEIVEATRGGRLTDPQNPASLVEAIEELALNPDRARELGEAGRRAVCVNFTADAMMKSMLQRFEKLAATRTPAAHAPVVI